MSSSQFYQRSQKPRAAYVSGDDELVNVEVDDFERASQQEDETITDDGSGPTGKSATAENKDNATILNTEGIEGVEDLKKYTDCRIGDDRSLSDT